MANIKCGSCGSRHGSVAGVQGCYADRDLFAQLAADEVRYEASLEYTAPEVATREEGLFAWAVGL